MYLRLDVGSIGHASIYNEYICIVMACHGPKRRVKGYKPREKANNLLVTKPVVVLLMRDVKHRSVIRTTIYILR